MSKQITPAELAEIVTRLLTETEATGELDNEDKFSVFMTEIAEVVCNHCGGEVIDNAGQLDDVWYVPIRGNDSLPADGLGIWADYDQEGELTVERRQFFPQGPVLQDFTVYLQENEGEEFLPEISFKCQAEDLGHAIEQAKDAYPGCRINYPACHADNWFITSGHVEQVHWDEENHWGFMIRLEQVESEVEHPETDTFTYKAEEWREGDIVDTHYAPTYQEVREWIGREFLAHCQNRYSLVGLCDLWNELGDITVTDDGYLEQGFLFFPRGVHREEVWHWFESVNPAFMVGEMLKAV